MYDALHFSQATRVGNAIWVSAHLAFQGLRSDLEAAGASLADVVELMTFHTVAGPTRQGGRRVMADLTRLPGTASLDEVIAVIERDGGMIVEDFLSPAIIAEL